MSKAIEVRNITKIYRLYDKNTDRLKESLGLTKKNLHKDFYALRDVSFDVEKGQSVGIIGTNGSGKSTMLKIITGVLTPTMGLAKVDGKVSALLELGAGFNMEYTGIENIYMNGTMMGFSKAEMDERLEGILKFADIGDFVYQPVKSYSSGMFVRLAFALAINVDPEILIVDEALSVGDIFFQAKCYHHMDELRRKGTTILMVTHDMSSVLKYCDKAVLLNDGVKVAEGRPGETIDLYKKILA
ncbi:MAG: ABC transporter ATP-binding protein, partial [Lachnospiraceae bacterium]|nr:ABC transporter ATP-binding protein [Lachnospiraceae bacterium]